MSSLAQQIEAAQDRNEQKISTEIGAPKPTLDTTAILHLRKFADWCKTRGVRACPASPASVAAYIRSLVGTQPEQIVEIVHAIELMHDQAGLANPVATAAVRAEL